MLKKNITLSLLFILFQVNCSEKIFDARKEENPFDFKQHVNTSNEEILSINGAGIVPLVDIKSQPHLLLPRGSILNGEFKDVAFNPSSDFIEGLSSVDMASKPEELFILGEDIFNEKNIKANILAMHIMLMNNGLRYNCGVPTYVAKFEEIKDLDLRIKKAEEKIVSSNYDELFPTASNEPRSDKITSFTTISLNKLIQALKKFKGRRIEDPLEVEGSFVKISPYVARTLALNLDKLQALLR